uniref:Uncharacterized protein n=1 Tax=Denticeps clupeoides TaxID=299321 RepID=A0AAY4CF12_9TELE
MLTEMIVIASNFSCSRPLLAEMKKAGQGEPKTTVTKALGDNPARKIPPGKSLKAPSTRYAAQNELREHNQLLASTNEALQKRLHEMQSKCSTLEQERSVLRGENEDILKRLRECHVLLVAENIDPVVGEKICQTSAQDEELRRATMVTLRHHSDSQTIEAPLITFFHFRL